MVKEDENKNVEVFLNRTRKS